MKASFPASSFSVEGPTPSFRRPVEVVELTFSVVLEVVVEVSSSSSSSSSFSSSSSSWCCYSCTSASSLFCHSCSGDIRLGIALPCEGTNVADASPTRR